MKNKRNVLYSLIVILTVAINFTVQGQHINDAQYPASGSQGPKGIVRTVKQDKKGNIWITSWEGVFKYDGKTFTNVTANVSAARFFSVLEDRKGNFWFASIGSGVYYYDGSSFKHFTSKDGLASDVVTNIYEDKNGSIWFGTEGGVSRYDGKSFRNFKMSEVPAATGTDSIHVSIYRDPLPKNHWMHNDVNAVVEDHTGKFWLATRGHAFVYDQNKLTVLTNGGKPFANVRCIIKDQKGNIWLGGNDGLWRYDGNAFTNFTENFVGHVYEDRKGNIWTSSQRDSQSWAVSRYDAKSVSDKKPTVTEIATQPMTFGILEDSQGNIWFGAVDGVYRYDGKTVTGFREGK